MRFLYKYFFERAGWKISGDVPRELKKFIIIVAPHTSNWDFPIGLAVRSIMRFKSNYLGKEELFRPPFGWMFRKLGGHPVDRKAHHKMVDQVAELFKKEENFVLAIAPEGTRKKLNKWRTGFYHIAVKAEVPVVMVSFDYPTKTVFISTPFYPSGDLPKDVRIMEAFFKDKKGKFRGVNPILKEEH